MGLELLEIAHDIEKAFGVPFSMKDYEEIVRGGDVIVGDLHDLLLKKIRLHDFMRYDIDTNVAVWQVLQCVLKAVACVPADRVELGTPLESLFPLATRRMSWTALREASPYRIPELDYPGFVRIVGIVLAAATVFIEMFQIWQVPGARVLWPLVGMVGVWMVTETYAKVLSFLEPLRNSLPAGLTTVKDLCRSALAENDGEIREVSKTLPLDPGGRDVWRELVKIIAAIAGVDARKVTMQSRLIGDLGI